METATTIAAFAGLILAIINLIQLICGNFIKTFIKTLIIRLNISKTFSLRNAGKRTRSWLGSNER